MGKPKIKRNMAKKEGIRAFRRFASGFSTGKPKCERDVVYQTGRF